MNKYLEKIAFTANHVLAAAGAATGGIAGAISAGKDNRLKGALTGGVVGGVVGRLGADKVAYHPDAPRRLAALTGLTAALGAGSGYIHRSNKSEDQPNV